MQIYPQNYNLTFEPDLEKFVFKGEEIIAFKTEKSLQKIVLDSADLKIAKVELFVEKKNVVESFRTVEKEEKLIIILSEKLTPGVYKLFLEFEGILNDKLTGFYRSRYTINEKEKIMATSQFEAADARRAFPSIDNPSYKATFDVSLIINKNLTAISNTLPTVDGEDPNSTYAVEIGPLQKNKNSKKRVIFETTPLMSTYLLYLGVGEFEWIEDKYRDIQIRVVTTPGKKQFGKFALEAVKNSLEYFEEYFNYPYPLKKLDLIAIPEFASGAMENWGAITFRENALLYYPGKSSQVTKQRIAEVVAHELAHQWFGNLVTMKWWDDLWLNESFATYMAYKVLHKYWPEWKTWSQYLTDTIFEGMALDSLNSSHPIKVEVKDTSELDELFDEIAYDKGGSILRMLNLYLGEEGFKKGLRNYISKNLYKNAQGTDLWKALGETTDKPVLEIMGSFITQTGFPTISVTEKNNVLNFQQERFLFEGADKSSSWKVPLVLKNGEKITRNIYLADKELELRLNPEQKLTSLNDNYAGFYISDYSRELSSQIGKKVNLLNELDRLGLVHDLFALILSGKKDLKEAYSFLGDFFVKESSSDVLHYIISKLTGIYLLLKDRDSKKLVEMFAVKSLQNIGKEPRQGESILDSYLRSAAISILTLLDNKEIIDFCKRKFLAYLKDEKTLQPDIRAVVYSSAVYSDDANYPIVKNLYKTSQVQEEKAKLLMSLGNTKSEKLISETLVYALDREVPFAFLPYAIAAVSRNRFARKIVLDWLIKIWPELLKRSGGLANMLLRRLLQSIVPTSAIGREKEIEKFLTLSKPKGLERSIEQTLEMLRINSKFVNKYRT